MKSLSIIIPVYNTERYIRPCLESIFRQGLDERCFEVIIINDGTKDNSIGVIQDLISQHTNITLIEQENQDLSVVRNNGIAMATGEFILMPDSDDLLIDNSLAPLLDAAISTKADLVVADFLRLKDEEIEIEMHRAHHQKEFSYEEKTGERLFLEDLSPYQCYVWRTLFRREFLLENQLKFVPGIYIQDVPFTHECYLKAKKCLRTPWLLNIYRVGHESATFCFNKKKILDFCTAIVKTWELRKSSGLSPAILDKISNDVYVSFSVMICSCVRAISKASERVEIMDYLKQKAPDLSFHNGYKQRIVTFLFRNMPHLFIHLRYIYAAVVEDRLLPFYHHKITRLFA